MGQPPEPFLTGEEIGLKGFYRELDNPKHKRGYWILNKWIKESEIPIDLFLNKKFISTEKYFVKNIANEVAQDIVNKRTKSLNEEQLWGIVEKHLQNKKYKFKYSYEFIVAVIAILETRFKKILVSKEVKTLDELFFKEDFNSWDMSNGRN